MFFAQFFGLCALVLLFMSYQNNRKVRFLFIQIFSGIFYFLQYFFLSAFSAAGSSVISILKTLIFLNYEKKNRKIPIYILIVFEIIFLLLGILTYQNIFSLMPIFIALSYTYGTWQKNLKVTYAIGIMAATIWIIYNFIVLAYISVIGSFVELIASIIGLKKLMKNK